MLYLVGAAKSTVSPPHISPRPPRPPRPPPFTFSHPFLTLHLSLHPHFTISQFHDSTHDSRLPNQSLWGNLLWCRQYQACRILIALVAFSWLTWSTTFALLVISSVFVFANGVAYAGEPMHGRWARNRGSWYGGGVGGPMRA